MTLLRTMIVINNILHEGQCKKEHSVAKTIEFELFHERWKQPEQLNHGELTARSHLRSPELNVC